MRLLARNQFANQQPTGPSLRVNAKNDALRMKPKAKFESQSLKSLPLDPSRAWRFRIATCDASAKPTVGCSGRRSESEINCPIPQPIPNPERVDCSCVRFAFLTC